MERDVFPLIHLGGQVENGSENDKNRLDFFHFRNLWNFCIDLCNGNSRSGHKVIKNFNGVNESSRVRFNLLYY